MTEQINEIIDKGVRLNFHHKLCAFCCFVCTVCAHVFCTKDGLHVHLFPSWHNVIKVKSKGKVRPNRNWVSQDDSLVPELNSGFCSMKRLGVFLLPLDGILIHRRLPPSSLSGCPHAICWFPFIHLGEERHCES